MKIPVCRAMLALLVFSSSVTAFGASLPPPLRAEIDGLLDHPQSSGCEFNRNGSWYSSTQARAHLQTKLDYLEGQEAIHSTEQFIELGASSSSMSGKPYRVRCAGQPIVESKVWLLEALQAQRAARSAAIAASGSK